MHSAWLNNRNIEKNVYYVTYVRMHACMFVCMIICCEWFSIAIRIVWYRTIHINFRNDIIDTSFQYMTPYLFLPTSTTTTNYTAMNDVTVIRFSQYNNHHDSWWNACVCVYERMLYWMNGLLFIDFVWPKYTKPINILYPKIKMVELQCPWIVNCSPKKALVCGIRCACMYEYM